MRIDIDAIIDNLENEISSIDIPDYPVELRKGDIITNHSSFIISHIHTIKAYRKTHNKHTLNAYINNLELYFEKLKTKKT